jgi:3-keto-disaccharide hydrolase
MLAIRCVFLFTGFVLTTGTSLAQYTNLLADRSLDQWTQQNGKPVSGGWQIDDDGSLHLAGRGGNLLTVGNFGDFDLWFEYKVATKGNNGIKYRVKEYGNSWLGLEYQIQDDAAFPKMGNKHLTAGLYDIFATSSPAFTREYAPEGEWNVGHITVQNNRIRHWMNGHLIIDECSGSPDWKDAVANSKFRNRENFGENRVGKLMLTDHNSEVWYRNVFVRRLDSCR